MKRILSIILVGVLLIAGGLMVFADDTEVTVHELSSEVLERINQIKAEFLVEKVDEGLISQDQADAINLSLLNQDGQDLLRELGFGTWLRESDYVDEIFELLPHKGMGGDREYSKQNSEGTRAFRMGNRDESQEGCGDYMRDRLQDGEGSTEGRRGRGRYFNSED